MEKSLKNLSLEALQQKIKKGKKNFVFDIDGTLVNSEKILTEKTKEALMKVQAQGHRVLLASGRPIYGLVKLGNLLSLDQNHGYLLSYNGGKVVDWQNKKVLHESLLPQEPVKELFQYCKENDLNIISYMDDTILAGLEVDEYIELESRLNDLPIKKEAHFVEKLLQKRVNKCLLTTTPERAALHTPLLQEKFAGIFSVYRSDPFFIEIMPLGVDKGAALASLVEEGILEKESLIAFGDSYNDLTMLSYAEIGIAMGNGKEEVKALATYHTESHDDDGVAFALEKILKCLS